MYPYIRIAKELWKFRRSPRLSILEPHISTHRVWPWDLDPWRELNNGRTLTLFDLGRIPMSVRMGFDRVAEAKGWGITVAGNSTRYRRRVTVFQKLTQVSRVLGWDARFVYLSKAFGAMGNARHPCSCGRLSSKRVGWFRRMRFWWPLVSPPKARTCPIGSKRGSPATPSVPGHPLCRMPPWRRCSLKAFACQLARFRALSPQRPTKGRFRGERDDFATQAHLGMVVL